jgi:hypothetical protein
MTDDFPAGWHKTIDDLLAEVKELRTPVGPPETEWAVAYERSLLRPWARFPLNGDVYEAIDDTPVSFMTHWFGPFTDGGDGVLPKGTRVRVQVFDFMPEPVSVYADPLDRTVIERLLVPESIRNAHKYGGFSLSVPTADLNRRFRLISIGSNNVAV